MKENKKRFIITTLITLIPLFIGLILWKRLPDRIATNFSFNGEVNSYNSKGFVVFGMTLFMTAIHLFTLFITLNDPKKNNIGKKMLTFCFWFVPVFSIIIMSSLYAYALNVKINIVMVISAMIGILFVILGNYMTKNHQNYSVGLRLPWTLNSEENWNQTHRFASKLWVIGGIFIILLGVLDFITAFILITVTIIISVIPIIYSFYLYKKGI